MWRAEMKCAPIFATLRRQYSEKIDEIAMKFGIQNAMDTKEEVERSVFVPRFEDAAEVPDEDPTRAFRCCEVARIARAASFVSFAAWESQRLKPDVSAFSAFCGTTKVVP